MVQEEETGDAQHTLVVMGELDFASADVLRHHIDALRGEGERIVLDLNGVQFIDSGGLAALVRAHDDAQAGNWTLSIVRPSERVQSYLRRTGLDRVLPIE